MKILLLGDENFTFANGFIANFPEDEVEIACCLAEDQLKDDIRPAMESLKEKGIQIHFGVNPAQLKILFNEEVFDRLVYILPGLAFHGCPDFIEPQSEMFKLRLHLFCFGFLKSAKSSIKVDGDVWFLWPDIEDDSVGFAHIEPDKLARFCCVKRSKADDTLFDSTLHEEWKPLVHNVTKTSIPDWLNSARYYSFRIDQDSKLDKSNLSQQKQRFKKRKASPLPSKRNGESREGEGKLERENEDSLADASTADDEEQTRFDDFNVLKIPPQVFQFDRSQLPHVNECFHFKLWGKNSQAIQVSKLTLKYDPRISGWKGDGSPGKSGGRDSMRGSKGGRGSRGSYRGGRGMKGEMMGRPTSAAGYGPGGMNFPHGYFNYANSSMAPPPPPEGMGYGAPSSGGMGYGPPMMMGGGYYGAPMGTNGPPPRGYSQPIQQPMPQAQSGQLAPQQQPPQQQPGPHRFPGSSGDYRGMASTAGAPPLRGQLQQQPHGNAAGGPPSFGPSPTATIGSTPSSGSGGQNVAVGRPMLSATVAGGGRGAPVKRGSDQMNMAVPVKRPRGNTSGGYGAGGGSGEYGAVAEGMGGPQHYSAPSGANPGNPGTSRQNVYMADGYGGYGAGGQGLVDYGYGHAGAGGYTDGYGGYVQSGYESYGSTAGYEKPGSYDGYNGYDGYGSASYGVAAGSNNPGGYDAPNYYASGGYVGESGEDYYGYASDYNQGYSIMPNSGYYDTAGMTASGSSGMGDAALNRSTQYNAMYDYNSNLGYDQHYSGEYKGSAVGVGTYTAYGEEYGQYDQSHPNAQLYDSSHYGEGYMPHGTVHSSSHPPAAGKTPSSAVSVSNYSSNSYSQYGRY